MTTSRRATDDGRTCRDPDAQFWDNLLRAAIARDLRSKYEGTVSDPLPERLARLIDQLETRVQQTRSAALRQPLARRRIRLKCPIWPSTPARIIAESGRHTQGGNDGSD